MQYDGKIRDTKIHEELHFSIKLDGSTLLHSLPFVSVLTIEICRKFALLLYVYTMISMINLVDYDHV